VQWSRSRIISGVHTISIGAEPVIHAIEILEPGGALRQTVVAALLVDPGRLYVVQDNVCRILIFASIPGAIGEYKSVKRDRKHIVR
jgi:hypothetical protein